MYVLYICIPFLERFLKRIPRICDLKMFCSLITPRKVLGSYKGHAGNYIGSLCWVAAIRGLKKEK